MSLYSTRQCHSLVEIDSNSRMTLRPQTVEELLFSLIESRNTGKYTPLNTRDFVTARQRSTLLFSPSPKKRYIGICSLSLARQHRRRACFRCVEDWKRISNIYTLAATNVGAPINDNRSFFMFQKRLSYLYFISIIK